MWCMVLILMIHITYLVKERFRLSLLVLQSLVYGENSNGRRAKLVVLFIFLCARFAKKPHILGRQPALRGGAKTLILRALSTNDF